MIMQDFKYAVRLLAKKPGFTILTTLVMATGIGLSVYLFSFFNMLFADLPFKDGESIVIIAASENGDTNSRLLSIHDYSEIRNNVKGLSQFGAYSEESVNVIVREGARKYNASYTEPGMFELTHTEPVLGRTFATKEDQVGAENVVIVGFDLWKNQYGGDNEVLDQILQISGESYRIIGVMPQGYSFPTRAEMWLPLRKDTTQLPRSNTEYIRGFARLDEDVSKQDINQQLSVIMKRIEQKYPKTNHRISAYIDSMPMSSVGDGIAVVYSMQVVAILILVLASINVGNLLLSRAVERSKETAIRVALGSPRARLISQMLWESIIICTMGGIIGFLMVAWGLEITQGITAGFFPGKMPFWWVFSINAFNIKLFIAFVLCTILVTGLLPAWKNSGHDFNAALRDGTRGALSKKSGRLNKILVISEILISLVVLICASVMVLSSYNRTHAEIGAETQGIIVADVALSDARYDLASKKSEFINTLQSRLENSTGVSEVMISSALPGLFASANKLEIEGKEYHDDKGKHKANAIVITSGTLGKLGVELQQGRYFDNSDNGDDKKSVIVTNSFVSQHFPKQSALGKRLRFTEKDEKNPSWLTIIGIVEHTRQGNDHARAKLPSVFRPYSQAPRVQVTVAMKSELDKTSVTKILRDTLMSIDSQLPAFRIETYTQSVNRASASVRFISSVLLMFGIAAVVLAGSGIYGVMSKTISQRTQEIGIKRALGADEKQITKELLIAGVKQLLWGGIPGTILGGALGFAMGTVMGVGIEEIVILSLTTVIIIGTIVLLATYLPTKKALQLEPSEALHHE
jgi:putative ABC transport system permease protein